MASRDRGILRSWLTLYCFRQPLTRKSSAPPCGTRSDGQTLLQVTGEETGKPARMWGPSIVGFGQYHYRYAPRT